MLRLLQSEKYDLEKIKLVSEVLELIIYLRI